ncbi:helicase-related protein [Paraburkholderia franconis]|uniref:helicase-related protein n=1 Tax=Paraburkholderia franconis TaxID=2654983 RepID=UPI00187BC306|nr:helicase-related protein [Paraburkholderia franconis]
MKQQFKGWAAVAVGLGDIARESRSSSWLDDGQCASLARIAEQVAQNGLLVADEVGMGKTRIAAALASAVIRAGGRVAILVPPALPYQWKAELDEAGIADVPLLRSLRQYMDAWFPASDRPERPWFDHDAIVISHAFANWRFGGSSDTWRWALMPELYAQWHLHTNKRLPYGYSADGEKRAQRARQATVAKYIAQAMYSPPRAVPRRLADALFGTITDWRRSCHADAYRSDGPMRGALEGSIGLGLGVFDLIILDEAHKSRGEQSVLSSLFGRVIQRNTNARCLALSATPVELSVQDWKSTLARLEVASSEIDARIDEYARAVERVRETPMDRPTRDVYKHAARAFQEALAPYLLRRDKREDRHVSDFERYTGEPHHAYRAIQEIFVETAKLSLPWRRAVCAAESLSLTTRRAEDAGANRLYLTFANGHGIAGWLRQTEQDETVDEATPPPTDDGADPPDVVTDKRKQRAAWWKGVLGAAFRDDDSHPLFDHPAILEAVKEIEQVCDRGEKVLVFGRFTAPLRALTELLNARSMLKSLDAGRPWPQATLSDSEWTAVQAAHRQLRRTDDLAYETFKIRLADQYRQIENQRRSFRTRLIKQLGEGLGAVPKHALALRLFDAFQRSVTAAEESDEASPLAQVARTLQELLNAADAPVEPAAIAGAFVEFVDASVDRGEHIDDTDADEQDAMPLWQRISSELRAPQGGFARLMNGDTAQRTRRLLQLAFNRDHSFPRVLVAQSMVGREGLNLHKACKTVVLLHHEWNPGVVEQQIGRVDRIGSLWQKSLDKAVAEATSAEDTPRIIVRPVIFTGTYDEWNWYVLRTRWDDLRAQLHGVVISPRMAQEAGIPQLVVDEINEAAPNFRPAGLFGPFIEHSA